MTSPIPTLIAELEEALKAATPGPWRALTYENSAYVKGPDVIVHKLVNDPSDDGPCGEGGHTKQTIARWHADARLIALMRNSLPTLIEAVKRQGEALEKIAAGQFPEAPDDADMLDMAISGRRHMMAIARAALTAHKEKSDV